MGVSILEGSYAQRMAKAQENMHEDLTSILNKLTGGSGSEDFGGVSNNILIDRNLVSTMLWSKAVAENVQMESSLIDITPSTQYAVWGIADENAEDLRLNLSAYDTEGVLRYTTEYSFSDFAQILVYNNLSTVSKVKLTIISDNDEVDPQNYTDRIFFGHVNMTTSLTDIEKAYIRAKLGVGDSAEVQELIDSAVRYTEQELTDEQKSQARANIGLDDIGTLVQGTVKYSEPQALTDDEQAQARANIGLDNISDMVQGTVKYSESQTLTDDQKAQARANIGLDNISAMVEGTVKYSEGQPDLTETQEQQARENIGAASAASLNELSNTIGGMTALINALRDNVSDVTKTDTGLHIDYANGSEGKNITLTTGGELAEVNYDDDNQLHFLNKDGEELYDGPFTIKGGSGGGGGETTSGSARIDRITAAELNVIYGQPAEIQFTFSATDSSGDTVGNGTGTWTVGGVTVADNVTIRQGTNAFDIGPYLNAGENAIRLTVSVDVGGERNAVVRKTWSINAVDMRFEWPYNDAQINSAEFHDSCVVYGNILKRIHTVIDRDSTEFNTITLAEVATSKSNSTQDIVIPELEHGAHGVERWLSATVGGEEKVTPTQYHEMIFVQAGNSKPIIAISAKDIELDQYNTVSIPVLIYDPSTVTSNATLYVDDVQVASWSGVDRTVQTWTYNAAGVGNGYVTKWETYTNDAGEEAQRPSQWQNTLKVVCGSTTREITVTVNAISMNVEEVGGYAFRFKASDFAANSSVKTWESNGVTAAFSNNFDWVNGGLKTETVDENLEEATTGTMQQYFCIKAGTRMTIDYELFRREPKSTGMTFKMVFKVKNCRNYNAQIMDCYDGTGIRMYAHKAYLNSSSEFISIPYGEEEYLELEFDIYPSDGSEDRSKPRYMMGWLDGVITTARVYGATDTFIHTRTTKKIELGSDDADLYVYMVKVYPTLLNNNNNFNNHISNFIMDAPNSDQMIRRYNRNDILDSNDNISYSKLYEKNPDLRIWLYDIPYMTVTKSDKVGSKDGIRKPKFEQLWKNGKSYYHLKGEGVMSVQGTSSTKYVRGAANTDINFTSLTDGEGNDLLAHGTKDSTFGGSNNWYWEDERNPGHAKVFSVLDAKINTGIRRSYTPEEAVRIARVENAAALGSEWKAYETNADGIVNSYTRDTDADADGELGPEWIVVERDSNRTPVKYIKALGYKINDDSCPITYSNTKVNFASCEQVNNMCNAIWYQRYNPYPSLTARDTMEFSMGVQFIKDGAENNDADHFALFDNTDQYNMYSIANMGTSKKNVHIFHDMSNPKAVCIEVKDNTDPLHHMTSDDFTRQNWANKDEAFWEMRYPDITDPSTIVPDPSKPDETVQTAWERLVSWFAHNNLQPYSEENPYGYTNEAITPETYGEYTFKGYPDELRPGGTQVLRGTKITQYAGTYRTDSFERRMAKMLSECEDYMVMDSFMYHFVYLERHTMVDNVSKNNFWSSDDLIHWDLSKAYDMDTSDGNDNQGKLVFDYGLEWNDANDTEDDRRAKVFNGSESVWFVFCANLKEACQAMFRNRDSAGAWSSTEYHKYFLNEQQKVPERCWNQTYWYDYLRTYENGLRSETEWIPFLDGGQKTHQRKHYESFQDIYMSSKYRGISATAQNVTVFAYQTASYGGTISAIGGAQLKSRAVSSGTTIVIIPEGANVIITSKETASNGSVWAKVTYGSYEGYVQYSQISTIEPSGQLTLSMYNKMYISIDMGTTPLDPVRVDGGTETTITFAGGTLSNAIISINAASMIQSLSGIEHLYPRNCVLSNATRLQRIQIGSSESGYFNNNLTGVSLGNNSLLERLIVANLPNATGVLNLTGCPALTYVDARGSGFTGYSFAVGGALEEAHLNSPATLSLRDLTNLRDNNFTIDDYSRLNGLFYENTIFTPWDNQTIYLAGDHVIYNDRCYMRLNDMDESDLGRAFQSNQWEDFGRTLDVLNLVEEAVNLQIARIIGIDWSTANTDVLARLYKMKAYDQNGNATEDPPAIITGRYYADYARDSTIGAYQEAWEPDLEISWGEKIPTYEVYFYDGQGNRLTTKEGYPYIQYVDQNGSVYDPIEAGELETPKTYSDEKSVYVYKGWDNLPTNVRSGPVIVTATYDTSDQTYTVRWFINKNDKTPDRVKQAIAGQEVFYDDNDPEAHPTKTDEENNYVYNVFKGWNRSTGYIHGDTDVYAIWDRALLPAENSGKALKNMSIAEIYGIAKRHEADKYWDATEAPYVDIRMGRDFDFVDDGLPGGVKSEVLMENRYFDGTGIVRRNDIQLFTADSPSFTLAVDYEFTSTTANQVLFGCYDAATSGAEGFILRTYYTNSSNYGIQVVWGDQTRIIGHGTNRGIVVIRHRQGSKNLYICGDNGGRSTYHYYGYYHDAEITNETRYDGYSSAIVTTELPRTQDTETNAVLTFGGVARGTLGSDMLAQGWIHWAKIWYDDLGNTACQQLAYWPHETWRMHYRGSGLYNTLDSSGLPDGASFVANALLSQHYNATIDSNRGESWSAMPMRTFMNTRCLNAFPVNWRSILQTVSLTTRNHNSDTTETTEDVIYAPGRVDVSTITETNYLAENRTGTTIPWFTNNRSRIKFAGLIIPEDAKYITSESDPTQLTESYPNLKEGDIWIRSNVGYYYVSAETASKHATLGGRPLTSGANIQAAGEKGGVWVRAYVYMLRSGYGSNNSSSYNYYRYGIRITGAVDSTWTGNSSLGAMNPFEIMFSI